MSQDVLCAPGVARLECGVKLIEWSASCLRRQRRHGSCWRRQRWHGRRGRRARQLARTACATFAALAVVCQDVLRAPIQARLEVEIEVVVWLAGDGWRRRWRRGRHEWRRRWLAEAACPAFTARAVAHQVVSTPGQTLLHFRIAREGAGAGRLLQATALLRWHEGERQRSHESHHPLSYSPWPAPLCLPRRGGYTIWLHTVVHRYTLCVAISEISGPKYLMPNKSIHAQNNDTH